MFLYDGVTGNERADERGAMKPTIETDRYSLYLADCRDVLGEMPANSINLIPTDPPYFKVKGEAWDRQWDTSAKFLEWIGGLCEQWQRVLKPNGSLYCFASSRLGGQVESVIAKKFEVLNSIRWIKEDLHRKKTPPRCGWDIQRSFVPFSESIIFAEHFGADNIAKGEAGYEAKCDELRGFVFEPLRKYLAGEFAALGWNADRLNKICGTASMAGRHYTARSQWCLPTAEHYAKLQAAADGHLRREYEDLRRPFSVSADVPYTDVWTFPTVATYKGKHPCEKPLPMMRHIVDASSRPDAMVFDGFMGSGATGIACVQAGRRFIGVEKDERYFQQAAERIREATELPMLFAIAEESAKIEQAQLFS